MLRTRPAVGTLVSARSFPPTALVFLMLLGCSNRQRAGLDSPGDDGGDGAAAPDGAGDEPPAPVDDDATFKSGDASFGSGSCKAGHYAGSLVGTYASYLTFVGVPITFTASIDLMLDEAVQGGEFPTYSIANGTLSGLSSLPDGIAPGVSSQLRCDVVGTLDCNQKKLVGGGLRNCTYCFLGAAFDGGTFYDGGPCTGLQGSFEGPLEADYNGTSFSFVNGTWSATDNVPFQDASTAEPEAGTSGDSGVAYGPGNYGGSGTWGATFVP
jgi:hypothetical protein